VSDRTRGSDETPSSPPSTHPAGGDRRGWLYGTGIALVVLIGLIVFAATRGGDGDGSGDMPGMDMDGTDMDGTDMDGMDMDGTEMDGMEMDGDAGDLPAMDGPDRAR